ncbi:MAG TPA: MoaD/ThiS family protein [Jiangellaceae bacterium]|nr:MoaD/ThiS family protein [Jiangellaceae bacterium]
MTGPAAVTVTVRYWAAARAAAGTREEHLEAETLAQALFIVRERHDAAFSRLLGICSLVVDEVPVGRRDPAEVALRANSVIEVLPPFAGGAAGRCSL